MTLNVNKQKDFSVFHTNVCSLQGDFEKLQTLITNLEFKFSVIAISKTWTSESKINICESNNLEGCQTYCGIKGKTLKVAVVSIFEMILDTKLDLTLTNLTSMKTVSFKAFL